MRTTKVTNYSSLSAAFIARAHTESCGENSRPSIIPGLTILTMCFQRTVTPISLPLYFRSCMYHSFIPWHTNSPLVVRCHFMDHGFRIKSMNNAKALAEKLNALLFASSTSSVICFPNHHSKRLSLHKHLTLKSSFADIHNDNDFQKYLSTFFQNPKMCFQYWISELKVEITIWLLEKFGISREVFGRPKDSGNLGYRPRSLSRSSGTVTEKLNVIYTRQQLLNPCSQLWSNSQSLELLRDSNQPENLKRRSAFLWCCGTGLGHHRHITLPLRSW